MDLIIHNCDLDDQSTPFKCYGATGWTANDVREVYPEMSLDEAEQWLDRNAKYITDAMVQAGWTAIECL